jgi:hypothetical protein
MNAHTIPECRTWDSGETLGETRRKRLSVYGVNREAESLAALSVREFWRMLERARHAWHVEEAKRAAIRLGSSATEIKDIAPSLAVVP